MLIEHINQQLLDLEAAGLRRHRRVGMSPCSPRQRWQDAADLLVFCSNDYLGLANHPVLIDALAEGARLWGVGSGASHLVSGHSQAHAELEAMLARWLGPHIPGAQALLFCSGYMANVALMTALGDHQATILSDKLNHASLIDGALLARAKLQRYPHAQLDALERQLRACTSPVKLIVTDAVFSMDGDVADVPALLQLAEQYDAWLVIDDAHGLGVLGAHGHGSLEHFALCSERLIYMGTLGKAAGVSGAFVAAHPLIIQWLVQRARPYIYTTAMPPALAYVLRHALEIIEGAQGAQRRARLNELVAQLRTGLAALVLQHTGLSLPPSWTPIQPLIVGDNARALALATALQARGIRAPAIRPPTVPVGTARLRLTLSASHTAADVDQLLGALSNILNEEQS
ncbi:8-amino-7-oxononanoate synthase [Tepidicella baoligensis]|uniref:8-amino-7-oxononanoate synthase n=1 Tax=Tepidicella baoligensis TaxID=2707016 RepID=UPI0015DB8713|nr:8-amino-7-oxononanoate synthase [Tepidicella baoligensis]